MHASAHTHTHTNTCEHTHMHTHTYTSREEERQIIAMLVKGWQQNMQWVDFCQVLSPRGVKTCQGDKTCRQCKSTKVKKCAVATKHAATTSLSILGYLKPFNLYQTCFDLTKCFSQILILFAWKKHGHLVTALTTYLCPRKNYGLKSPERLEDLSHMQNWY